MKKQATIIILVMATLVVISGCAGKNQNNTKPEVVNNQVQEQPNQMAISSSLENRTTSSETIDTSNWEIYKNDKYGFELKYLKNQLDFNEYEKDGPIKNTNRGIEVKLKSGMFLVTTFDDVKAETEKLEKDNQGRYFTENIYYLSPEEWKFGQESFNNKSLTKRDILMQVCEMQNDYLICYTHYQQDGIFVRKDIKYKNNIRYEFITTLPDGLNWSEINKLNANEREGEIKKAVEKKTNEYFQNIFNKDDQTKIKIIEKMKQNILFF